MSYETAFISLFWETFSAMPLFCSFRWFWRCSFKKPEDKIVNTPQLLRVTRIRYSIHTHSLTHTHCPPDTHTHSIHEVNARWHLKHSRQRQTNTRWKDWIWEKAWIKSILQDCMFPPQHMNICSALNLISISSLSFSFMLLSFLMATKW